MPYLSELLNKGISDTSDSVVGTLQDIVIEPLSGAFPALEFLAVKNTRGRIEFVPYDAVSNFNSSRINIKYPYSKVMLDKLPDSTANYAYLRRDVLDKQIVDIKGTRVVRVNDLRIGNFNNRDSVLAIDASFRGLIRRLIPNIKIFSNSKVFPTRLIDWRQAQLLDTQGTLQLNTAAENLREIHPADLANIVEDLGVKQGSKLLVSLDPNEAAKVLEEVDPSWQNIFVKYLGPEKASKILAKMSTDEIADLVKTLTGEEASSYLSRFNTETASEVRKLVAYPDNTAGGLMTLDYVSVRPEMTASQVIDQVRKQSSDYRSIVYIYVTDEDGFFRGVFSMRRLILAGPELKAKKMMKVLRQSSILHPEDRMEKIIRVMTRYNLYTAVVLDQKRKMKGIITIDDVMNQIFPAV